LYQAFRNNKLGAKVRTKLVFNDNNQGPGEHSKLPLDSTANPPSKMIIDDVPLINSAIDFCKSKVADISVDSENVDKVRVMVNPLGDQLHASNPTELRSNPANPNEYPLFQLSRIG